jgi:acyl-CoA thioesterase FadM
MSPVYPEERILVLSRTEVLGEKSLTMVQEIINHPENEQKVFNRSVMVGYSAESRSTIEIPLEIKDKIMEFEKEVKVKKVSLNPDQRSLREN